MSEYYQGRKIIHNIREHYRSGISTLANDFFQPCIKNCSRYSRAVGYFSSSALISWVDILPKLNSNQFIEIKMLISPSLSEDDLNALKKTTDVEERILIQERIAELLINNTLEEMLRINDKRIRLDFFTWMVINGYLHLKFAFPEHIDQPGIFHEKIGVFEFPWGDRIAFTGSANETHSGYKKKL